MIVLDIETQHLADEVGGWDNLEALQVAVAVTWDSQLGYQTWWEGQAGDLLAALHRADVVVGYNITAFDYAVLSLYGGIDEDLVERTFDILEEIRLQTGKRVGLNVVAMLNLGEAKGYESGADAVKLWRDGRLSDLEAYCRKDVELTKRLYELWEAQGILWVSAVEFCVWPGPVTVEKMEERKEDGHDTSAFARPRRGDFS